MSWLEELKVNDKVIITKFSNYRGAEIAFVDRVTKTQIIANEHRFRKEDGHQVGGYWITLCLQPWTIEEEGKVKVANMRYQLSWLSKNDLERIRDDNIIAAYELLIGEYRS